MLLIDHKGEKHHIPTKAIEVFDVSGAGDTVIAAFTAMMVANKNPVQCAHFANTAAGIVVGKHGTATVTLDEIEQEENKNVT